jgi:Tol biopolymer transport system component
MPVTVGAQLGSHEITALLGKGGMGEVYRARDLKLKREVAIKILPEEFSRDADRVSRLQREAEVLASLSHPNIAGIHSLEEANGSRYLVLELVEGETLADRIARGPIPIEEALDIARSICEALEAAHEKGVIHRDLKPANVKITPEGKVKVLDFGLAKAMDPGTSNPSLSNSPTLSMAATNAGVILGTAGYMSPEQAKGRTVDKRTDIFAFGCVLYEMLTGRRAFAGDELSDVLASVLAREPDWTLLPRGLSPVLGICLKRCLHKDRRQRIGDAQTVRLALEGAFETEAAQVPQPVGDVRPAWRRALPVTAALMVGGLLVALTAWIFWPSVAPQAVSRFNVGMPSDQVLRQTGHSVIAISPDGRHFVYNTAKGLYLRAMSTLDARLLAGTEGNSLANPFFSPDGESVGYFEGGQLKRISISGGTAVPICAATDLFSGARWSLDDTILFGQAQGIMRVSANGGTPELLIPAGKNEVMYGPQLLPDGKSVLFSVTTGTGRTRWDQAQVVVQSLRTGKRMVLRHGGSDARYVPTGHLIYAQGAALFAVSFDVDGLTINSAPVSILEGIQRAGNPAVNTAAANYAVSERGTLVYVGDGILRGFVSGDGLGQPASTLVWVDRAGREEPLGVPPRVYTYPRLSPDGTRVAVAIGNSRAGAGGIWIWDVRRQTMTRFTFSQQQDNIPVWSPDGRRLVWASQRAGGPLNIYWQAADGTGATERLTESPNHHQRPSSFTPDGQRLLLMEGAPGAQQDLGMLPLNGDRRVTWLLQTTFSELGGEVSPDGRWLVYESDESGQSQIYVRPFPAVDQGRWQVSTNGGQEPVWARNGREVFYLAPDGAVMVVPVDVPQSSASPTIGAPAKLIAGEGYSTRGFNRLGRTYDVSPDGRRFLRIKVDEGSPDNSAPINFVVVQNWFSELKQKAPVKR